jgi:hypothetical protein
MTLEEKLVALIKPVCPRVSPDFASVATQRPYVTFQQIGGEAPTYIDNTVPWIENAAVQVNVWANSRIEAKALMKQIEAALITATTVQARPVSACVSDFDADIPVYGSRQDFSIWAER